MELLGRKIDISLVDDIPTVRQVLHALRGRFVEGAAFMAEEFLQENDETIRNDDAGLLEPVTIQFAAHEDFKTRVPQAVGLIRTADTTQFGNIILESA